MSATTLELRSLIRFYRDTKPHEEPRAPQGMTETEAFSTSRPFFRSR